MFNQSIENMLLFLSGIEMAHQPKIMDIVEGWWRLLFHQMNVDSEFRSTSQKAFSI